MSQYNSGWSGDPKSGNYYSPHNSGWSGDPKSLNYYNPFDSGWSSDPNSKNYYGNKQREENDRNNGKDRQDR